MCSPPPPPKKPKSKPKTKIFVETWVKEESGSAQQYYLKSARKQLGTYIDSLSQIDDLCGDEQRSIGGHDFE